MKTKLNTANIEKLVKNLVTFSKKNIPTILMAGSVVGFWSAGILLVKQAPKAKEAVDAEEAKRVEENKEPMKQYEKAGVYARYCWGPLLLGTGASAMSIASHKIDLSRLAEMVMLTKLYKEDGEKLKQQFLKKYGQEELDELKNDILIEEYPDEKLQELTSHYGSQGQTLFIDVVTGAKWSDSMINVMNGINTFDDHMRELYDKEVKRQLPFDMPWNVEYNDPEIYAKERIDIFLEMIGEHLGDKCDLGIGDLLEFRCYSDGDLLKPDRILTYEKYINPETKIPQVCFIDYREYLAPSSELLERYSY